MIFIMVAPNDTGGLIIRLTCIAWIAAKAISLKLWIVERFYPTLPILDLLQWVPNSTHWLLLVTSCLCMVALIAKPDRKAATISLMLSEITSCMLDQTRWQPWEYQYIFIIFIFAVNFAHRVRRDVALAFLFALLYIYSGLHKLNGGYLSNVWRNLVLARFLRMPNSIIFNPVVVYAGYLTALAECLAGFGLFFSKTKQFSAKLLITMHVFILLLLGPIGLRYNIVVWPWNILMIACLYLLFIRQKTQLAPKRSMELVKSPNLVVLICWGVLPLLSFAGSWYQYFSSSLYAGNLPNAVICIKNRNSATELAPFFLKTDKFIICDGDAMINVHDWAMKEMNVPPIPEAKAYQQLQAAFLRKYPTVDARLMLFYGRVYKRKEVTL